MSGYKVGTKTEDRGSRTEVRGPDIRSPPASPKPHSGEGGSSVLRSCYTLDMSKTDISAPLKPAVFHILLALADGPVHGYAAMQRIRERSGGSIRLNTG